jgi:hypothetical protein
VTCMVLPVLFALLVLLMLLVLLGNSLFLFVCVCIRRQTRHVLKLVCIRRRIRNSLQFSCVTIFPLSDDMLPFVWRCFTTLFDDVLQFV